MKRGSARIVFDLAAHALDERVDAALGDVRVAAPDPLHQRFAAEHDAAVAGEQVEQVELVRRELDLAVVEPRVAPRRIDVEPCTDDRPGCDRRRGRLATRAAAQQRAHARDELAHAERLRQVVVGAALEAEHLVGLFAPRREHQDRDVAVHAARAGSRGRP